MVDEAAVVKQHVSPSFLPNTREMKIDLTCAPKIENVTVRIAHGTYSSEKFSEKFSEKCILLRASQKNDSGESEQ